MVRLIPMTQSDFEPYLEHAIYDYAQEHVKAGTWDQAQAVEASRKEFEVLLPNGVASENQFLFSIQDDLTQAKVGMLWFALKENRGSPFAFIYDFNIYPEFQRKGYGAQALEALEVQVKQRGLHEIELHVFGHNHAARALYDKAGYETRNIRMVKKLD